MSNAFSKRNILFASLGIIAIAVLGYYVGYWEQFLLLPAAIVNQHKIAADIGYLGAHGNVVLPAIFSFVVDAAIPIFVGWAAFSFFRKGQKRAGIYAAVVAWYGAFLTIGFMNVLGLVIVLVFVAVWLWAYWTR